MMERILNIINYIWLSVFPAKPEQYLQGINEHGDNDVLSLANLKELRLSAESSHQKEGYLSLALTYFDAEFGSKKQEEIYSYAPKSKFPDFESVLKHCGINS